jgi:hypothetical protein
MNSSFLNTLTAAVNGVVKLEECAKNIANDCLDDVLLRISQDYNLDFTKLVEQYKEDVVERHATMSVERQVCRGHTNANKPCTRFAVSGGYCRAHIQQGDVKKTLDNKGMDYSDKQVAKKRDNVVAKSLTGMGIQTLDATSMKVSKTDHVNFFD